MATARALRLCVYTVGTAVGVIVPHIRDCIQTFLYRSKPQALDIKIIRLSYNVCQPIYLLLNR